VAARAAALGEPVFACTRLTDGIDAGWQDLHAWPANAAEHLNRLRERGLGGKRALALHRHCLDKRAQV